MANGWKQASRINQMLAAPGDRVEDSFVIYHEELESGQELPNPQARRFLDDLRREYLTHLQVIQNIGKSRIDPVKYKGGYHSLWNS